jgi:integrase
MPRRSLGPRLYWDRTRKTWVIRDGPAFIRTGAGEDGRRDAEKSLARYIAAKYFPEPSGAPLIDDVLAAYGSEHAPHTRRPENAAHTIANLLKWWSGLRVADVTARRCREFSATRRLAAARRDLETLRAAIGYWHREYGPLPSVPAVVLPDKSPPRERWLTRSEAARLLWAARRRRYLVRFILIGLYTGTRSGAILELKWEWIDLERGIMRRREAGESEVETKRRPVHRLNRRLLSHLRRWRRLDGGQVGQVVHNKGQPVTKLRNAWVAARERAGLDPGVSPHVLRHTRVTWLLQAGVSIWETAGSVGMSAETVDRTYGHHSPSFQKRASEV